jgi:hypothetical protein
MESMLVSDEIKMRVPMRQASSANQDKAGTLGRQSGSTVP